MSGCLPKSGREGAVRRKRWRSGGAQSAGSATAIRSHSDAVVHGGSAELNAPEGAGDAGDVAIGDAGDAEAAHLLRAALADRYERVRIGARRRQPLAEEAEEAHEGDNDMAPVVTW